MRIGRLHIQWMPRLHELVATADVPSNAIGYDKKQRRIELSIIPASNGTIINCDGKLWLVHPGEPLLDRLAVVLMDNKLS